MSAPQAPDERTTVRVLAEALEDAALRYLGRDLGTLHRDDIAQAGLDALAAAGYAVVRLPEPAVTVRVCGCGDVPGGPPGTGCSAECMDPAVVSFGGRVDLDVQDRTVVDGGGDAYTQEVAALHAAALLAAARWPGER